MKRKTNLLLVLLVSGGTGPLWAQADRDPLGPEKGVSTMPTHRPIPPPPRDEKVLSDQDMPVAPAARVLPVSGTDREGMSGFDHRPIPAPPTDGRQDKPATADRPAVLPGAPNREGDSGRDHRRISPPPTDEPKEEPLSPAGPAGGKTRRE